MLFRSPPGFTSDFQQKAASGAAFFIGACNATPCWNSQRFEGPMVPITTDRSALEENESLGIELRDAGLAEQFGMKEDLPRGIAAIPTAFPGSPATAAVPSLQ